MRTVGSSLSGGTDGSKPYTAGKPIVIGIFTCTAEETFAAGNVGVAEVEANNSAFDSLSADKMTIKSAKISAPELKKVEAKASNCKDKGNNEYYVCECEQADCDRIYKADRTTKTTVAAETLDLAEHKFTSGTVDAKYLASAATYAVPAKYYKSCAVCGEKDSKKHGNNTEVKGKLEPTETAEGYTGDTYCKDCGELIAKGTTVTKVETSKPTDSSNSGTDSGTSSTPDSSSGSGSGNTSGSGRSESNPPNRYCFGNNSRCHYYERSNAHCKEQEKVICV